MFQFGIMGAGNIASQFCDAVKRSGCAEVAAVASRTSGKAKAFAEKNNVPAYYASYEEMLARDDIDGVYVATTHNFHHENMIQALSAGKHVLCEKAFTMTKRQAAEVFALAEEKQLFCMEAMWSRFLPAIRKAKEWIDAGLIGDVNMAHFMIGFASSPDENGRMRSKALGGGAMFDISVYAIEITSYLIGKPIRSYTGQVLKDKNGVDTVDVITLCFDGCIASLQATILTNVEQSLQICGTKGRIKIPDPHYSERCMRYDENGLAEEFYERRDNGFQYEIREMVSCIEAGKLESGVIPHCDTLQCAEIFDACLGE